ncbi:MAG: alpha/beta fold hydrolase [Candidatus Hermodarchaeota archaeon]
MQKIPFFKKDDTNIYYIKEGEGEPLVLISGLGSKMSWTFQLPFFRERMMVITLHNRGTGNSSRPNYPYTMDMFVEDINNLLNYLEIEEKIHLCGISMGGVIAQHFVLKYPERVKTLILCATTPKLNSKPAMEHFTQNADINERFKTYLSYAHSREFRKKLKQDKELYDTLRSLYVENPTRAQDYLNQASASIDHDTTDLLHKIMQPTLIMGGTKDRLVPLSPHSEILHEKIPNSELKTFEGLGHSFIIEDVDAVNKEIWDFVKKHLG